MPRIPPSHLREVAANSTNLRILLPAVRALVFARTELRWIQDEVRSRRLRRCQRYNQKINDSGDNSSGRPKGFLLKNALDVCGSIYNSAADAPAVRRLCRRRGRGEPLQYVLGNQPFGPLEILCKRGVLIPRCVCHSLLLTVYRVNAFGAKYINRS